VALLQEKKGKSLERALELLQETVFSFSMKVCGQRQDAEDTMQEVLLRSVPNLPKFTSPKALMVWLYKVAKTRCLMSRRKSNKQMFAELSNYLDEELDDSLCVELEKHMDGCKPCQAFLASLEKTIRGCRQAPNQPPDPRVAAKLRREVLSKYQGLMVKVRECPANETNQT